MSDDNFKKCPYCAEQIEENSEICPYCKTNLIEPNGKKNSDTQKLITTSVVLAVIYFIFLVLLICAFLYQPSVVKELDNMTQKQKFDVVSALLHLSFFVSVPAFISICFAYKKKIAISLIALNMISASLVSIFAFLR